MEKAGFSTCFRIVVIPQVIRLSSRQRPQDTVKPGNFPVNRLRTVRQAVKTRDKTTDYPSHRACPRVMHRQARGIYGTRKASTL